MKLFIDTEFTKLSTHASEAELISIGLITEDGDRSFYAEITDGYSFDDCSNFVKEIVLPLLDAPELTTETDYSNVYARMTMEETRTNLSEWLELLKTPVTMYTDAPVYDGHLVYMLFKGHPWPRNLEQSFKTCVPQNERTQFMWFMEFTELIFRKGGFRRHHALDDAKVMRLATLAAIE